MADDDLEYHIKFPSPTPRDSTPTGDNEEFTFLYDEDKLPVVVLLGWAGCQDKHLAKYSVLYEDRGCITLRCTPPVSTIFFRHDRLQKLGERLLDLLTDMSLEDHPIIFHIFSNGGAYFYHHISREMQKRKKHPAVRGVIFDSAPGERRFYSAYRALNAIIGGSPLISIPVAFLLSVLFFIHFFLKVCVKALKEFRTPELEPILLKDEPFAWPQLFVYSKTDELVKYEDINKFIEHRKTLGVNVTAVCFDESPHVQHLKAHREVYINTIVNFLQGCFKTYNSKK